MRSRKARRRLEHANFQAGLEWARGHPGDLALRLAVGLGRYWYLNSSVAEGSAWLDEAVATGAGDPPLRATALLRAGQLALLRGDHERADVHLAESLRLKRDQGDEAGALALPAADAARRELGTDEFEGLAEEGAAMTLEEVLEEALARPGS